MIYYRITSVVLVTCMFTNAEDNDIPPCGLAGGGGWKSQPGLVSAFTWVFNVRNTSASPCLLTSSVLGTIKYNEDKEVSGRLVSSALTYFVVVACPEDPSIRVQLDSKLGDIVYEGSVEITYMEFRNCRLSWDVVVGLARLLSLTYQITLQDVRIVHPGSSIPAVTLPVLSVVFRHSECFVPGFGANDYAGNQENPCPLGNSEESENLLEMVNNTPMSSFPQLAHIGIENADTARVGLDLSFIGETSNYLLRGNNLTDIPNVVFPRERKPRNYTRVTRAILQALRGESFLRPADDKDYQKLYTHEYDLISKTHMLRTLNLPYNKIHTIPAHEQLLRVDDFKMEYNLLGPDTVYTIENVKHAFRIQLNGNNIRRLPDNVFGSFTSLELLDLSDCGLVDVDRVNWTVLTRLKTLDIGQNHISSVESVLLKTPSLRVLFADFNRLTTLPAARTHEAPHLFEITAGQNRFITFPSNVFTYVNLHQVFLHYNHIDTAGIRSMLNISHLHHRHRGFRLEIFLMFNCIEFIPLESDQDKTNLINVLQSSVLILLDNPLHCGCSEFRHWLRSEGVPVAHVVCDVASTTLNPENLIYRYRLYSRPTCRPYRDSYPYRCAADIRARNIATIISTLSVGFLATLVMCLVCRRYRVHIQSTVYVYTGKRMGGKSGATKRFKYDAYVVYSGNAETTWVKDVLVRRLEVDEQTPYRFRLCLPDRDFLPGEDLIANVVNAMEESVRCVLLLSSDSLSSEWGRFQHLNALWEGGVRKRDDYVVPILFNVGLGDLPRRIRNGISRVPCLSHGMANFWRKLEFALAEERVARRMESIAEDVL